MYRGHLLFAERHPARVRPSSRGEMIEMRTSDVRSDAVVVPLTFDRALTDVLRSRRMVEETELRLTEALVILRTLEEGALANSSATYPQGPADHASWAGRVDDAIRHLAIAGTVLRSLLREERPSGR